MVSSCGDSQSPTSRWSKTDAVRSARLRSRRSRLERRPLGQKEHQPNAAGRTEFPRTFPTVLEETHCDVESRSPPRGRTDLARRAWESGGQASLGLRIFRA